MKKLPSVVIVGKPNSGKSTLFNRIVGSRKSITHKSPGVTRDFIESVVSWNGVRFRLIDTGGFDISCSDPLNKEIKKRIKEVSSRAGVIIFLADVDTGPTDDDDALLKELREEREKIIIVVNKVENLSDEINASEFYKLGFKEVRLISALHGRGVGDLMDEIVGLLPKKMQAEEEEEIRIAIIGKPNVGKSSIVNAIAGEERNIVSSVPGTTRDVVDVRLRRHGKVFILLDTAGIRRRSKTKRTIDKISSIKGLESVNDADVVLAVLDATQEISRQDVRLASQGHRTRKGVIVLLNKWDLVRNKNDFDKYVIKVHEAMPFLSYAPVMAVSALAGIRIHKILEKVLEVREARRKTIATSELNRAIEKMINENPPKFHQGGTGKVYYATQTGIEPPTFTLFVNKSSYFPRSYIRYINNQLRKLFTFEGTAIKISLRSERGK